MHIPTNPRTKFHSLMMTSALVAVGLVQFMNVAKAEDYTLPEGGEVVGGDARIEQPSEDKLDVHQSSDRTVINWDSFNIGTDATVQFYQPSSTALAVNRVVGRNQDPTKILGTLKANGRVMVLDRNGVIFGKSAVVDVGGITASTGDVDTAAVMRGDQTLTLSNFGTGEVVNEGQINVSDSGLAAFVAPIVKNSGVISAKMGRVVLAAAGGETATIDLYGDGLVELAVANETKKVLAENTGTINAEGGRILMAASAAKDVVDQVINADGVINATSATVKGGKIILSGGQAGVVTVSGELNADGSQGGGAVEITGRDIAVKTTAKISASALENGNGGSVYIKASRDTNFEGQIFARGRGANGQGGWAEVSGETLGFNGDVDLGAENGSLGTLLLDPAFAIIHSGNFSSSGAYAGYVISAQKLANAMKNSNVTVQADDFIDVGTSQSAYNINTGDPVRDALLNAALNSLPDGNIDLSTTSSGVTTAGSINLVSDTVNFNRDLTVGKGSVHADANTINLGSRIYGLAGGSVVTLGQSRLSSTASQVNVLSNAALIQQGLDLVAMNGTVDVGAGTYNEDLTMSKDGVTLRGAKAGVGGTDSSRGTGETIITPHSPGIVITGDNITVDGLTIDGASNGIFVDHARNTTLKNNIIKNSTGHGIYLDGADIALLQGNLVTIARNGIGIYSGNDITLTQNWIGGITGTGVVASGVDQLDISYNHVKGGRVGYGIANTSGLNFGHNVADYQSGYGLYVWNSDGAQIRYNRINNVGRDAYHIERSDSILLEGNRAYNTGGDGFDIRRSNNAVITGNFAGSDNDGVSKGAGNIGRVGMRVRGSDDVTLTNNLVQDTQRKGIVLKNAEGSNLVANNQVYRAGTIGILVNNVDGLVMDRNRVNHGITGIEVRNSDGADIRHNVTEYQTRDGIVVSNSDGAYIRYNRSDKVGNDAFRLYGSDNVIFEGNRAYSTGGDGYDISDSNNLLLTGNFVGSDNDGVSKGAGNIGQTGIRISGSDNVELLNNVIRDAADQGLLVSGAYNGYIKLAGNTFTDNRIGAEFQSGLIDLTGATNKFIGGDVGLLFSPVTTSGPLSSKASAVPTGLQLVDNTIGTTFFSGQSQYYIKLENGAFYNPGTPTIIDGSQATYDGVFGGLMTEAAYSEIESKLFHWNDDNSLGLFFYGSTPVAETLSFDEKDVFRDFEPFTQQSANTFSITILGLPSVGGFPQGQRATGNGGSNFDFANLEPAAGEESEMIDGQSDIASNNATAVSDIQPASGDSSNETSCWGDTMQSLDQGQAVTLSYGMSPLESLRDVSRCQSGQI